MSPRRFVTDLPAAEPPAATKTYPINVVIQALAISETTFKNWQMRGLAPRREVSEGHRARVSRLELQAWAEQLEIDRKATGKTHLRHPLISLSWVARAEALRREAHFEQLALAVFRSAREQNVPVSDDMLGQMIANSVRRAKAKAKAEAEAKAEAKEPPSPGERAFAETIALLNS